MKVRATPTVLLVPVAFIGLALGGFGLYWILNDSDDDEALREHRLVVTEWEKAVQRYTVENTRGISSVAVRGVPLSMSLTSERMTWEGGGATLSWTSVYWGGVLQENLTALELNHSLYNTTVPAMAVKREEEPCAEPPLRIEPGGVCVYYARAADVQLVVRETDKGWVAAGPAPVVLYNVAVRATMVTVRWDKDPAVRLPQLPPVRHSGSNTEEALQAVVLAVAIILIMCSTLCWCSFHRKRRGASYRDGVVNSPVAQPPSLQIPPPSLPAQMSADTRCNTPSPSDDLANMVFETPRSSFRSFDGGEAKETKEHGEGVASSEPPTPSPSGVVKNGTTRNGVVKNGDGVPPRANPAAPPNPHIGNADFAELMRLMTDSEQRLRDDGWTLMKSYTFKDGSTITVYSRPAREGREGLSEYYTVGEIHVSPKLFFMVNNDLQYRPKWDKYCKELKVLEEYDGERDCCVYWNVDFPFPLTNRDYVYYRQHRIKSDGTLMTVSKSAPHDRKPPGKLVRVETFRNNTLLQPSTKGSDWCSFRQVYFDDPGGNIPKRLIQWFADSGIPQFVEGMLDICRKYRPDEHPAMLEMCRPPRSSSPSSSLPSPEGN